MRFTSLTPFCIGFVSFALLLAALSGCKSPAIPDPEATALETSEEDPNSPDWVSPETINRYESMGLEMRDTSGMEMAGGELAITQGPPAYSVYFGFDRSAVRPEDRPLLQEAASRMRQDPSLRLLVEGHCDWRGTTQYNLALGDRRAGAIRDYLIDLGIQPGRIEVVSRGDLQASENASESDMQRDRRADLYLY